MKNVKRTAGMLALGDFNGCSEETVKKHIVKSYESPQSVVDQYKILIAFEDDGSWEGDSHFLIENKQTGQLFEVHASHCSCYGFEDQFIPEETTAEYLKSDKSGWFFHDPEAKKWISENIRLTSKKKAV